jgi:signal transduction histidine kinase
MNLGVRARLTLWYVAAMVVVLTVYAAGVFMFVHRSGSRALDARLRSDFTWAAEMWEQQSDGTVTWFDANDAIDDEDNPWLQVWTERGDLLFQTAVARRNPLADARALAAEPPDHIVSVSGRPNYRVLSRPGLVGGHSVIIQVARSDAPMRRELGELTLILVLGLPFGVAAAGLGGYALARGALAPVTRMAARAQSITAARLNDRLPVDHPHDELGRLAVVFNETLERLEQSFQQMQHFTGDVSHELRTPLTAIRTVGEVALR